MDVRKGTALAAITSPLEADGVQLFYQTSTGAIRERRISANGTSKSLDKDLVAASDAKGGTSLAAITDGVNVSYPTSLPSFLSRL